MFYSFTIHNISQLYSKERPDKGRTLKSPPKPPWLLESTEKKHGRCNETDGRTTDLPCTWMKMGEDGRTSNPITCLSIIEENKEMSSLPLNHVKSFESNIAAFVSLLVFMSSLYFIACLILSKFELIFSWISQFDSAALDLVHSWTLTRRPTEKEIKKLLHRSSTLELMTNVLMGFSFEFRFRK